MNAATAGEINAAEWPAVTEGVPNTLDVFATHFPRRPVLPGVLILKSLAELGARRLEQRCGGLWRLDAVERVRFRHFVRPGDHMELSVRPERIDAGAAVLGGTVRVDGRPVTTVGRMAFIQVPGGEA
jgi:3-hydroxyacyl-[acyl-carrier-protein] dehydratase